MLRFYLYRHGILGQFLALPSDFPTDLLEGAGFDGLSLRQMPDLLKVSKSALLA